MFSKARTFQAVSLINLSPRARTGIIIFSITFFSGLYLWYSNEHRIEDLAAYYRSHFGPGASEWDATYGRLETKLAYQEDQYQDYLKDRQGLIKKWGPSIEQVKTFPHNGQFYTMWDFFIPAFSCPFPVTRTGQLGDGGKFVCGLDRIIKRPNCIVYSLGVEGDSSFEAAILRRSSTCTFYGFDYSVSKVNGYPTLVFSLLTQAVSGVQRSAMSPPGLLVLISSPGRLHRRTSTTAIPLSTPSSHSSTRLVRDPTRSIRRVFIYLRPRPHICGYFESGYRGGGVWRIGMSARHSD